jgi:plastocyanin
VRRATAQRFGAVVLTGAMLVLAACGEDRDDAAGATTSAPADTGATDTAGTDTVETYAPTGATDSVLAIDNNFLPQTLTIVAGTEVVFENNGRNAHNVVPEGDLEVKTWGVLDANFEPKATYSYVFTKPGTYTYYCTIHGTAKAGMFGTIVVTAP